MAIWLCFKMKIHIMKELSISTIKATKIVKTILSLFVLLSFNYSAISQELVCRGNLNVSLDQNCSVMVSPPMMLTEVAFAVGDYTIEITDAYGNVVDNMFDSSDIGNTFDVMVCMNVGIQNCCWGTMTVEDKFPPVLDCNPGPFYVPCNGVNQVPAPTATENCSDYVIKLINEVEEVFECETYTGKVTRTYVGVDAAGNSSAVPCVQEIYITRPDLSQISAPPTAVYSCSENFVADENGYPAPWVSLNSGSGSGVPILCVPGFDSGVACHTGSGAPLDGVYMIPGPQDQICNTFVLYEDTPLPQINCTQKIMRRFEVREWWCGGELSWFGTQFIEIVDDEGPAITCPANMTVTTDYGCNAEVLMPAITPVDGCGAETHVTITVEGKGILGEDGYFPGAFLESNGGEITLPVGPNIVTYTAYDACYNSSSCSMTVMVTDRTQPVAICESDVVVSLPSSGNVEVWAQSFDDGSWDECGINTYEVTRMASSCDPTDVTDWDDIVSFCCADVGSEVMVALRVTDVSGNTNLCMVTVMVQDKTIPSISCPADMTITCIEPYDLNNLSLMFGDPVVDDNCMADDFVEDVTADINSCGTGTITRDFSISDANGNVVTACQQVITVIIDTPTTENDIIWPANEEFFDICNTADTHPDIIGYPEVLDGVCDLMGFNFTDEVFENVPNSAACAKILRTWKVINWCQTDANGNIVVWEHVQSIVLFNTVDPVISSSCDKIIATSNDIECSDVFVSLTNTATDDCTPVGALSWSWTIDILADGDASNDISGTGNDASGEYPLGEHILSWTVMDLCGNFDFCDQLVSVVNTKGPNAVCIYGLSAELVPMDIDLDGTNDAEMVVLWAEDFDAESAHPCGYDVFLSFSADITDTNISFGCNQLGMQSVDLWVTDSNGGTAICESFINITNNIEDGLCGNLTDMVNVEGRVATESNKEIESVLVNLEGSNLSDMTDEEGHYAFANMPMGGAYQVNPTKNDDLLNGVSTLDIILIQRHILKIAEFSSPYQFIAADVNNSGSVSALDLISLRKVILGVNENFTNNESWRFIDAEYDFYEGIDPLSQLFNEDYNIPSLSNNMAVDFVGVKIGDVNGSVVTSGYTSEDLENRSLNKLMLEGTVENNALVISVTESIDLRGIQMTIDLGDHQIDVSELTGIALDLKADAYYINNEEAYITLSWYSNSVQKLKMGDALFSVQFEEELAIEEIQINSSITKAEAYDKEFGIMEIGYTGPVLGQDIALYQNEPNPWVSKTSIKFDLDVEQEVVFYFRDATGKLLNKITRKGAAGNNELALDHSDLRGATGVIYYEMQTATDRILKKMIIVNN